MVVLHSRESVSSPVICSLC